ncbi:MAG: ParB/RepB/Spo0J family partition protein [Patescibacteria group bacterium]
MEFYNDSIFWIDVEKVKPNPFQPRREFDEEQLRSLSNSIRQYGVLQPLVVTRKEVHREDGSMYAEYELISGERRLRASRLAGLLQVPAVIRGGEQSDRMKLELAIIENLQREDLNPIDRAKSFKQLADQFGLKHTEIAEKIGKSREYVSNTMRLLIMPEEIQTALAEGRISEGHTRPILMLIDRPEEQMVLFKEIMQRKMTVREAEGIARRIAYEKVRKPKHFFSPDIIEMEEKLTETLGTRVQIESKGEAGGKIHIDYFNESDLRNIMEMIKKNFDVKVTVAEPVPEPSQEESKVLQNDIPKQEEEETYSLDNFTV